VRGHRPDGLADSLPFLKINFQSAMFDSAQRWVGFQHPIDVPGRMVIYVADTSHNPRSAMLHLAHPHCTLNDLSTIRLVTALGSWRRVLRTSASRDGFNVLSLDFAKPGAQGP
jgi:hypothetical protein